MTDLSTATTDVVAAPASLRRYPLDVEHLGIRIAVPLLAFAALILGGWLIPQLLEALGLRSTVVGFLQLPLIVGAAIGGAYLGDRLLKGRWLSGRELRLDESCLVMREKDGTENQIVWDERVNVLAWRFTVARRGRVPKGYVCLALQFIQDEQQVTFYGFVNPKQVDSLPSVDVFTPLAGRATLKDERLSLRVAGQQRRLLQAEDERWRQGGELTADDFIDLWTRLQDRQLAFQG
jgi:hypothetical protein